MWQFFQCAVTGRGHEQRQIPCQDKTYKFEYDGVSVISLADGAGSARLSHYGASRVSEFIAKDLAENFNKYYTNPNGVEVKKYMITVLKTELEALAEKHQCSIKDFASTLLFAAVKDDKFIIGHIGDGVIGYIKNNEIKVATHPSNGEFANVTVFVTSNDAISSFRLLKGTTKSGIDGFVLFSDGTENSFYDKRNKKISNAVKDIMNLVRVAKAEKIKDRITDFFERKIKQATTDDCSMAIMVNNHNRNFADLDIRTKADILGVNPYKSNKKKKIQRYQEILFALENRLTIKELSRLMHLKKKYMRKKISKLIFTNLLEIIDGKYQSILYFQED